MSEVMPTETREKWADACASYKTMKEACLAMLEHPNATEEEMMQAAMSLRNARMQLESARVRLAELFPRYEITLRGVSVQINRTRVVLTDHAAKPTSTTSTPTN